MITRPVQEKDGAIWFCRCKLPPISPIPAVVHGEDPLDCFLRGIKHIRQLIEKHKELGYQFWWLKRGDDGCLF